MLEVLAVLAILIVATLFPSLFAICCIIAAVVLVAPSFLRRLKENHRK